MIQAKLYINGKWQDAARLESFLVKNPATNQVFARVAAASQEDIEKAVDAAEAALPSWAALSAAQRGAYLKKAADEVRKHSRLIAELMTREQGKPLKEAEAEALKGADILAYYAEEGQRIYGRIIENSLPGFESRVIYQPVGVSVAISPWNYPVELLAWKVGACLAAGCALVAKLPSAAPLSPGAFIEKITEAGIPPGVLNAVCGSAATVSRSFFDNPKVKKVAFTGSTSVGKNIAKSCAGSLKKVSLELGGSLPMLIFADCDLEAAACGATRRSFRNMGQICIAVNRVYVEKQVYEPFLKLFKKKTEALVLGNGLIEDCDLGPMTRKREVENTKAHIKDALDKGASLITGGKKPAEKKFAAGNFFEPSILRDTDHSMKVMREETFGPLVGVMPFKDLHQAIALANDTPYGLAAIAYTSNISAADKLSRELEAGNLAINNVDAGVINAPYGGWKESGYGHEHGPEGLYEYLKVKHIRTRFF